MNGDKNTDEKAKEMENRDFQQAETRKKRRGSVLIVGTLERFQILICVTLKP